jgi:large subunit ribosomal protein L10
MPKTKEQKKKIVEELKEKIARAKSIVFASYNGLGVKDNEELRLKLRQENDEYYVAKKTLFALAFKDKGIAGLDIKKFVGQVAAVFGYSDEVSPAKIVGQFKKDKQDKIEFIGGILENKYISEVEVAELAKLPSRKELYAKIVGSINAPVFGLVNALAGNLRNLVYVLKAVSEKK